MTYLLIAITGLLTLVALFTFLRNRGNKTREEVKIPDEDCCGAHEICEKNLKKIDEKIEYFEDEELDIFKGVNAEEYNDDQIDMFREVLYTLKTNEINDWFISLEKRQIEFPLPLRQEAIELIND